MEFIADLHLHSHFSRATAKNLTLESLYIWAQKKGVTLVGTGDFTHPGWIKEIEEKLEPAAPGLFKLKKKFTAPLDAQIPGSCKNKVRFILQCEISSIYKKNNRVRKNHNLIYFPDLEEVKRFNVQLDKIGNIASDGRPILGLDAEKLLEIMLDISDEAFLIPAHIWTPWFSMLGSKSGFDTIEECFGNLSRHIFAVETGLSSDPPMNWRVADLDHVRLVASSDAHSPMYLGRNASMFNTGLSYYHVREALKTGDLTKYKGTIDMFPQEGKYHHDGHRKCGISFDPVETLRHDSICPVCGKPLTLGVLYRVQELASRPPGYAPTGRQGYQSIIPLTDILSEIFNVGPKTKKVNTFYERALESSGPELDILLKRPLDEIDALGIPLLAPAIEKMRTDRVDVAPGFDGEYGRVCLFTDDEKKRLKGEQELFAPKKTKRVPSKPVPVGARPMPEKNPAPVKRKIKGSPSPPPADLLGSLNKEQHQALLCHNRPLIMAAGPGTGKTRTITAKIAWLIKEQKISPDAILALTFTNRAAREMKERIQTLLPESPAQVCACTFHAFGLMILKEYTDFSSAIVDDTLRLSLLEETLTHQAFSRQALSLDQADTLISRAKQQGLQPGDPLDFIQDIAMEKMVNQVWQEYQKRLESLDLVDFEDLINKVLALLTHDPSLVTTLQKRFQHLFVDEYQDVNKGQYLLTKCLAGNGDTLCVIGDPDQSIYGFRGSDNRYFRQFIEDYPRALNISLKQNYRSTETILEASHQMLTQRGKQRDEKESRVKLFSNIHGKDTVMILKSASERAEAVAVGKTIEKLTGGLSLFSMDTNRIDASQEEDFSFSDFAVLYRTRKQGAVFAEVLEKAGIPCHMAHRENTLLQPGIKEPLALMKIGCQKGTLTDFELLLDYFKTGTGKKSREHLKRWFQEQNCPLNTALGRLTSLPPKGMRRDIHEKICHCTAKILTAAEAAKEQSSHRALDHFSNLWDLSHLIKAEKKRTDTLERLLMEAQAIPDPAAFLDHVCLVGDVDTLAPQAEKVALMTMHASKGLEFKVVFITGCETGLIPFSRPDKNGAPTPLSALALAEERRLFYVAMTRAQSILCVSHADKRRIYGKTIKTSKSPFVYDIEEKLKAQSQNRFKPQPKKEKNRQLELFQDA
ncbi:TIGR00375 family protein [Desulfocicer vacuolatum DSM 3385]|uniref:DNA 3'-5' helicase n=1 Tax=Desulfocicer vacuolatum DSM 3385 TaxID=1121400 RepID=A0A1W2A680_9BACT|nr:UvrD-helicase domain-containing protein [Desulfocicer vacuolatum]SMC55962.1 TIGR00375 family protein [Desulfocicer vacuolatum DSM 3385]